ncbi:hypothetical protein EJ02DRAFT_270253 [Clathrospora elynae]|uniref:Rhodopsin domain-containing protein n=1 Tax=Clathrospora elynae TaxID=706981 RepID=A0A6A5SGV1_9PLEO|nr:hypothetical protein EJ02DRAFT_270253 [Clathrospora elynae]
MDSHVATPAGTRVNSIVLSFTLIAGVIVFLRMFTRLVLTKRAGLEDVCIVFSMVSSIALAIVTSQQVMHGLGMHSSNLTSNELDALLKDFWASVWIYNLALIFTKVSILVQYLRIFPVRRFRQACFAMLGMVVAYGIWAIFSSIFMCTPVAFSWDKSISHGHCTNQLIVWILNAAVNIAQDLVIFVMPMAVIRTLRIPKGQKKGLVIMFALGAFVTLVSVVRLYSLGEVSNSKDVSFDNTAHASLSAVEVNVGIICACLPAMRPLFAQLLPQYFSAAIQYTNIPVVDIERPRPVQNPSGSTPGNTSRTNSPQIGTPRARTDSVQENIPLQTLKPTLYRTPSGHFTVINSRSHTPLQIGSPRSASSTRKKSNASSEGRMDPLRMSPFSPPLSASFRTASSPLAPDSYMRRPSGTSTASTMMPRSPGSTKPLPLTPLPVGPGD